MPGLIYDIATARRTRQNTGMPIQIATHADLPDWITLRTQLWDDTSRDDHLAEAQDILAKSPDGCVAFLDIDPATGPRAFAEASLRHDHVNGCDSSPVAFLEGVFVHSDHQGAGIGRALLTSVQAWAKKQGCSELASDANLNNVASHAFHRAFGFDETERVVFFRKPI